MCRQITYEVYCRNCEATHEFTHSVLRCETCLSPDIVNNRRITCDCGTSVYLEGNTNECEGCGELYNLFGQKLKPKEEWEEEY